MNNHQHIHRLFEKYLNNSCTPEEAEELIRLLQSGEERAYVEQLIDKQLQNKGEIPVDDEVLAHVFARLNLDQNSGKNWVKISSFYKKIAAVALIFIAIAVGTYYYRHQGLSKDTAAITHDVAPGGNRATLKLGDGHTINLSAEQSGIIVGNEITYADGSKIIENGALKTTFNSISTPKGGHYQITLPDGTNVWLNAASTLTYPVQFDGDKRMVELEGEAYFEVSHQQSTCSKQPNRDENKRKADSRKLTVNVPFIVKTKNQEVEVLGTQFNINAYPDENTTNTTLLEGSVKVVTRGESMLLTPGQQSKADGAGITIANIDVETAVDWKNGDFVFDGEDLKSIMRKVARWYDVEVVYKDDLPNDTYNAQISRNKNLSEVLQVLELSGGLITNIENNTLFISSPR
ncbi:FecR family protein [Parapedobacter tibetensis]|uniref:FecR family protein n=1 Tax=Parapedobacter tibetensis TaxID=2972951 RepID=UPI00214DE97C|nr:FecR family protein [Parapedobacter tibetensis]